MTGRNLELEERASATALLGYLNFSDGQPDARWQKQFHDAYAYWLEKNVAQPWASLVDWMSAELKRLHKAESAAFRDVGQAQAVLDLLPKVLIAYRAHHRHLLAHLSDAELFQPFLVVRVVEAILSQDVVAHSEADVVAGALTTLNDYVGYRPVAILETRPKGEPYAHERFRPVPLYLRDAGVACGRYHELLEIVFTILRESDADLLQTAQLDLDLLDELALDVRAYDQGHPANRRPNYVFGEWDPHHIDNAGNYRRFVVRQLVLDAMLRRVSEAAEDERDDALFESAAVVAGTILMASGICGHGPAARDAASSLAVLIPDIAHLRDHFYERLIERAPSSRRERLQRERETSRQAFGGARQYVNAHLARDRAAQLQQRALAIVYAEMGHPAAGEEEARKIPTVSVRFLSEIHGKLAEARLLAGRGRSSQAVDLLPEIQDRIEQGIDCGALADPWNVLGFQGLYPLSPAQEDGILDTRVDELLQIVDHSLNLAVRLCSASAVIGERAQAERALAWLGSFSTWWDQFATVEVGDVRRVSGEESLRAARSVVKVLSSRHERGADKADLAFWREHLPTLQSSQALAQIVEALLDKEDFLAALALLASWVGHVEQAPLEDGPHSFHVLALRWMRRVTQADVAAVERAKLVRKFFDLLEANAEEHWSVPALDLGVSAGDAAEDDAEDLYGAAYEDVTSRDSTRGDEGSVVDGSEGLGKEVPLEQEAAHLQDRMRFLATIARCWQLAARTLSQSTGIDPEVMEDWTRQAHRKRDRLMQLMDRIHEQRISAPLGSYDSLVEHDRLHTVKERLLYGTAGTCVDVALALGALRAWLPDSVEMPVKGAEWDVDALQLERAILSRQSEQARLVLARFTATFRKEQLLLTTLADGGAPRQVFRVRLAQAVLRFVLANLPRLGLLKESFDLLKIARGMEKRPPSAKRGITDFAENFRIAFSEVVEQVVGSSQKWEPGVTDHELIDLLNRLTAPFLVLWVEHSRHVQLSAVENVRGDKDWRKIVQFIRKYGRDFFHARFLMLGNLRGILHRGVADYLAHLEESPESLPRPADATGSPWEEPGIRLIEDIRRGKTERNEAARIMEMTLQSLVAHYEQLKDFCSSTTQSDYGENIYLLLDFLRVKAGYERQAWQFQPLIVVHEVLARQGRHRLALLWESTMVDMTRQAAAEHLAKLTALERETGTCLRTVRDRLEERFVAPLALDRLCAYVGPALAETLAKEGADREALARFREAVEGFAGKPVGVGLDVPAWLKALGEEVRNSRTPDASADGTFRAPRLPIGREQLREQIRQWTDE